MDFSSPLNNLASMHFDLVHFMTGMQQGGLANDRGWWEHEALPLHKENLRKIRDQLWVSEVPRLVHQHCLWQWKRAGGDVWSRCSEEMLPLQFALRCTDKISCHQEKYFCFIPIKILLFRILCRSYSHTFLFLWRNCSCFFVWFLFCSS